MFRQTLAQIKLISYFLPDPQRAERAMTVLIYCSFKLCRKVLTKDLLNVLRKREVGTNEVENCVARLDKNSTYKSRDVEIVKFIMKRKLHNAEFEEKKIRKEFTLRSSEYDRIVPRKSNADIAFKSLMRTETDKIWRDGKFKNWRKINFLTSKYQKQSNPAVEIRHISYRDLELDNLGGVQCQVNGSEPRLYGGVEIGSDAIDVLKKDPNFMILSSIDTTEIEIEIEKGLTKARYELMSRGESNKNQSTDDDDTDEVVPQPREELDKPLNYANLRATDIPTVQRLGQPKNATIKKRKDNGQN